MHRKTIGLALSFGGVRGAAHIGVIKCLLDHGINIDFIAGCSTGSLVGSLYCQKGRISDAEKFFTTGQSLLAGQKYLIFLEYRRKMIELKSQLGGLRIEDLKIPFQAVATNVDTGEPHIFEKGDLYQAVSASVAIPVLMPKVRHHRQTLIDGAMTMPIPVDLVKSHCDICIAVDLFSGILPMNHYRRLGRVNDLIKGCFAAINQLIKCNLTNADFIITPQNLPITASSVDSIQLMMEAGYQSALPIVHRLHSSTDSPFSSLVP